MGDVYTKTDSKGRDKVQCFVCSEWHHRLDAHLSRKHAMSVKDYNAKHPGAPTISAAALDAASTAQKAIGARPSKAVTAAAVKPDVEGDFKIGVARLRMRDDLTELEKAYVPAHDEHWLPGKREMEQWECLALGIQNRENVFMFGPTGCGKSTLVEELAAALNQPMIRVQLNQRFTAADFVGEKVLEVVDGKEVTTWKDGVLPQAMRNGWWILLDEITAAPAGVLMKLQAVLEGKSLVLTENHGEVVKPHQAFRFIATDNTNGRGDDTGLYAGVNVLNEATLDRFGVVIKAEYPDLETEVHILNVRTGISGDKARKMVECARKVREAFEQESCYCTFSTRRLIAWATKAVQLNDVRRAARIAVVNKLSGEDARFVDGLVQRYFGGEV